MARTRVWQLLQAYRGKPTAKIDAIVELLIRLGQLADDRPEIRELDINPLLADANGAVALDARLRLAPAQSLGRQGWRSHRIRSISRPSTTCATAHRSASGQCALKTSRCCTI